MQPCWRSTTNPFTVRKSAPRMGFFICNLENQRKPPTLKLERDDPEAMARYPGSSGSYEVVSRVGEAAGDVDGMEPEPGAWVEASVPGPELEANWSNWMPEAGAARGRHLVPGASLMPVSKQDIASNLSWNQQSSCFALTVFFFFLGFLEAPCADGLMAKTSLLWHPASTSAIRL